MREWSESFRGERLPDGTLAPTEWLLNDNGELEDNWFELNNPDCIPREITPAEIAAFQEQWRALKEEYDRILKEEPDHPLVRFAERDREMPVLRITFHADPLRPNDQLPPNSIWRR